jgi:porin
MQWRMNNHWAVLGGIANANGDPSDPIDSARTLFESGETFKHPAIGWSPDWDDRYSQAVQLSVWQVDDRVEAGVEGGHGVALAASFRSSNWRPFFRAGYSDGGGPSMDRAVGIGTGYDVRGWGDLAGIGLNWDRAPESSRNQYTMELFYRYDPTDFLQVTPVFQYIVNPANDPDTDDIRVPGLRARLVF